jgi:acetyl esterase/lipase
VIVCPGGGYCGKADYEGAPVARWLNSVGLSAFVLDYRVVPYKHPYPLLDAQRAIRVVRCHALEWGIKPDKIGILGFSAGGHLSATAGTHFDFGSPDAADLVDQESCRPDALVLCYPVVSFGEFRHDGSMVALLGENPPDALRFSLSNETQVTNLTPPAFIWHTANDEGVPVENSLLFAGALSKHQVPFELHVFPDGAHGLALGEGHPAVSAWTGLCATWLHGLGF